METAKQTAPARDIELTIGVRTARVLAVLVETDGTIRSWDSVAGHYVIRHDLTRDEIAEAQRLAGLVWAGTHYTSGGFVFPRSAR